MNVVSAIKKRQAARSLTDIDIPESSWKPDFDLIDRYQSFANELMRISLLGIAGYGYLISEVCMKDPKFHQLLYPLKFYLLIGAALLGLSLGAVLLYRFISSECLFYQILILRSLKRLENGHWSAEEKEAEKQFLNNTRTSQRSKSIISTRFLAFAAVCFALGFIFVIIFFGCFIVQFAGIKI